MTDRTTPSSRTADLTTSWLGLTLTSPVVLAASPVSRDPDLVQACVEAGASAVVLHSVFEEQLIEQQMAVHRFVDSRIDLDAEARSVLPSGTGAAMDITPALRELERLKARVAVPVVASLNGTSPGGWTSCARQLQDAGADALELNLYDVATDPDEAGSVVEARQLAVVRAVCAAATVPVTVKLSPFYASVPAFVRQLEGAGARGVTVFNRFYQPDIDLDTLDVDRQLALSTSSELTLRLHALAILSPFTGLDLGCTGGVHTGRDAARAVVAGAHVVQVASAVLARGPGAVAEIVAGLRGWLDEKGYRSVQEARGVMNLAKAPDPHAFERLNYARLIDGWRPRTGSMR
jgi:dihydroorotate dehydrogenase (fumarate)